MTTARNIFEAQGWVLKKIEDDNNLRSFDCDDIDLNEFFRSDVLIQRQELLKKRMN